MGRDAVAGEDGFTDAVHTGPDVLQGEEGSLGMQNCTQSKHHRNSETRHGYYSTV
jgi:hypothetical protein